MQEQIEKEEARAALKRRIQAEAHAKKNGIANSPMPQAPIDAESLSLGPAEKAPNPKDDAVAYSATTTSAGGYINKKISTSPATEANSSSIPALLENQVN